MTMHLQDIIEIAQEYASLSDGDKETLSNIMSGEAIAKQDSYFLPQLVNFLDWVSGYDNIGDAWPLRDYISDYLDDPTSVPPKFGISAIPAVMPA